MSIVEIVARAIGVALYVAAADLEVGSTALAFVVGSGSFDHTQLILRFLLIAVTIGVLSGDTRLVVGTSSPTFS